MPYFRILAALFVFGLLCSCANKGGGTSTSARIYTTEAPVSSETRSRANKALAYLKEKEFDRAEREFKDLMQKNKALISPLLNLSIVYIKQDRLLEAESVLRKAIERKPMFPQSYNMLGVVLRKQGRFAESESAYKQALDVDSTYANAHINIAVLYDLYLLDYEKAKRHYRQYAQLQPEDVKQVNAWMMDLQQRAQVSN